MTKKILMIIGFIIITLLLALNVYMSIDSKSILETADNNNFNTQSIVIMDKFRLRINEMCQAHKLYLLTGKEEYRAKYEKILNNNYLYMEELLTKGSITEEERAQIAKSLDEYYKLGLESNTLDLDNGNRNEIENEILKSNITQQNILASIDKIVEEKSRIAEEENNIIMSSTTQQKSGVQTVSTIIASVVSAFLYTLRKFKVDTGKIDELLKTLKDLMKKDTEKDIDKDSSKIKNVEKEILNFEKELQSLKIIYKQTYKVGNNLSEVGRIIDRIEIKLDDLNIQIDNTQNCSSKVSDILVEEINGKLIDLKVLLSSLPIYNETIAELSKEIVDNHNKESNSVHHN